MVSKLLVPVSVPSNLLVQAVAQLPSEKVGLEFYCRHITKAKFIFLNVEIIQIII